MKNNSSHIPNPAIRQSQNLPAGSPPASPEIPPVAPAPSADSPPADSPVADSRSADVPSADVPSGDAPSGDVQSGDVQSGDVRSGDVQSGDAPSGDAPSGDVPSGDAPSGDVPSGDAPSDAEPPRRANVRERYSDPVTYNHPYDSMRRFARLLTLRFNRVRTRHSYYRDLRLIHQFLRKDPALITEEELCEYFIHVKTVKHWKPKTIRQTAAAARLFFIELMELPEWRIFSQIRAKDHGELPPVLTREQVRLLINSIRLRRYRTPLKLIYCAGLRLNECLALTIHDIKGDEGKLWIRNGKGGRDRMVPVSQAMVEELRRYYGFHRHPLLIFPNIGRGSNDKAKMKIRMRAATDPIPVSSLQRLMVEARRELGLPYATIHTLRHSFATHLVEAGISLHVLQALLGHRHINTTMLYLHLTHRSEQDCRKLVEGLCEGLF